MKEIFGNIWDHQGSAVLAITTNGLVSRKGRNAIGRGCARQAAEICPELPERLGALITAHGNHVFSLGNGLVSFPVEHTPFERPDLRLIEQSARELALLAENEGWQKVVVPRPACGGGGLSWKEVRPVLDRYLDDRFYLITNDPA